jgi:prepilin-type N-terminal cleavage/methylation domain-containing protein
MRSTPSTRESRRPERAAGYTLIELLVGMLLSSIVLAGLVWEFGFSTRTRGEMDVLAEAQQGVRAAISALTQELRQAGACLPRTGDLVALDGRDGGDRDELTLRIGRVREDDLVCIRTVLTEEARRGASALLVQDTAGFASGNLLYLRGASGTGKTFGVVGVGTWTISLDAPLEDDYPSGSGVFAIEERAYAIDGGTDAPILTVAVDGEEPHALVHGVEAFNVRYVTTPCPPCDEINEPADDDQWLLVREVAIEVTVRSRERGRNGDFARLTSRTNVKPRNLL